MESSHTTRASLLIRVRNLHDTVAWREFDAIYRPILQRFAQQRGLSGNDVDDVVQFVMEAICRKIGSFRYDPNRGRFKGWLRTIVDNRIRNLARRKRPVASLDQVPAAVLIPADDDAAFERIWMQEHLRYCLDRVREEIQPRSFDAFHAYVIDERPTEQVCREHNMTAEQLYALKWRALRKLRSHLNSVLGDET